MKNWLFYPIFVYIGEPDIRVYVFYTFYLAINRKLFHIYYKENILLNISVNLMHF